MTARHVSSSGVELIRIPPGLSISSEPAWKPSPSSVPSLGATLAAQSTLSKDVEAAISSFKAQPGQNATTTPTTQRHPDQNLASLPRYDISAYADFILVPGSRTKKKIYTLAPVFSDRWDTAEYVERFDYVQSELRRAIDRHRDLRDHAPSINFQLNMVGTCPQSAEPSIIIICREAQFKSLRALFKEKAGEKLYCGKRSKVFEMFKKEPPARPPFNLVYWRTERETLKRRAALNTVSIEPTTRGELLGASVYYQAAQANVGATFIVGNLVLSTTVDHLFNPTFNHASHSFSDPELTLMSLDSELRTLDNSDLVSLNPLWIDDSEDDYAEGTALAQSVHPPPPCPALTASDEFKISLYGFHGHKVDSPIRVPHSAPYLDYALLQLSPGTLQTLRPNMYNLHEGSSFQLRTLATEPRYHAVPVLMLSGNQRVRPGRLLGTYAYLGSQPGQESCKVWTLILDGNEGTESETVSALRNLTCTGLTGGDCGSVIVDRDTHFVYGHVIGSNPMNQSYVVPFAHIVEQVKLTFRTASVSLYDPLTTPYTTDTTARPDTGEFGSECPTLVPHCHSDSSSSKTTQALDKVESKKDNISDDNGPRRHEIPDGPCICTCGRKYQEIFPSQLRLKGFFRNAPRPTSRTEALAFWVSMLEIIQPANNADLHLPAQSFPYTSLVRHMPEQTSQSIRPESTNIRNIYLDEGIQPASVEREFETIRTAQIDKRIAPTMPEASSECESSPCRFCQGRKDLQKTSSMFSIGGLLLESLIWVLTGNSGLHDLQQRRRRRNSDILPFDRDLQLFNSLKVSLHDKVIAEDDSASLNVLHLTELILNQKVDFPEVWRWQQKMSEEFEKRLARECQGTSIFGKRICNKQALDSFILQNITRADPRGHNSKPSPKFRSFVRRLGYGLKRILSREAPPSMADIGGDRAPVSPETP